jgi:serine/threonine-protein kinase
MMKNIVAGMQHAHEDVGIIHRDLKPSNIMAARPNQFRIIDFGMSIFIENELHSRLTKTGENAISGYYTAPELIENPKLIDKRSDIYSLGSIWYTLLTGRPPAGSEIIKKIVSIKGVDKKYSQCIEECLSDIGSRIPNCNVLLEKMNFLKV